MLNPARRAVALALLAVAIVAGAVALDLPSAAAQSDDEQTGRIVARRLADGRTEFGWQPAGAARVLPRARYFPTDAQVGRWLNSSPVEVEGAEIGRINARLLDDGRIEFAFTPTDGERIEPPARYFPVDARVGRWLRSTEITISAAPAAGFVAIAAGFGHSCAIRAGSGAIVCWGSNTRHIRNEETEEWEEIYVGQADAPAGSFSAVSAGSRHTCAIRENGAIECWGLNDYGQADAPAGSFSAVSAGSHHTCAIRENGAIECWGRNSIRVWLAPETYEEFYDGRATPPEGSFTAVSAGENHTCAIRAGSGAIECWGKNEYGKSSPPAGRFTAIAAGDSHTCAIRDTGEIECWGSSLSGETDAPSGMFSAISVRGGFARYTCGLRDTGTIECWGSNLYGTTDAPEGSFTAVSAGENHTCGLRASGAIECWGSNLSGQTDAPAP